MWRQFFEGLCHEQSAFVTLTYADEYLPAGNNLVPKHMSDYLKRLRWALAPRRVRFFGVGEYGTEGTRLFNPHYHLTLYGVSGSTDWLGSKPVHYGDSELIWNTWGFGNTDTQEFNEKTAQYVAGYTTKKMTAVGDPRLKGRTPEFMRSSRRPGLGAEAMRVIATQLSSGVGLAHLEEFGDVPRMLKLGKKDIPLGRFLLQKLREEVGFTPEYIADVKGKVGYARSLEMLALFANSRALEEIPTFKKAHVKEVHQRVLQAEARYKIFSEKKGTL